MDVLREYRTVEPIETTSFRAPIRKEERRVIREAQEQREEANRARIPGRV